MKKVMNVLALCLLVVFMVSCQTKEDKVIKKINALTERIENQTESFTEAEWNTINSEVEAINKMVENCQFDADQKAAYAKAEAELTAAIAKQRANEAVNGIKDAVEEGKEVVNGIIDGIKEGLSGGEESAE